MQNHCSFVLCHISLKSDKVGSLSLSAPHTTQYGYSHLIQVPKKVLLQKASSKTGKFSIVSLKTNKNIYQNSCWYKIPEILFLFFPLDLYWENNHNLPHSSRRLNSHTRVGQTKFKKNTGRCKFPSYLQTRMKVE